MGALIRPLGRVRLGLSLFSTRCSLGQPWFCDTQHRGSACDVAAAVAVGGGALSRTLRRRSEKKHVSICNHLWLCGLCASDP